MSQCVSKCDATAMGDAAAVLIAGGLVAFPTETVYGLGADACNAVAVGRIYSVKGRPADHPLIVHVASIDALGAVRLDTPLRHALNPNPHGVSSNDHCRPSLPVCTVRLRPTQASHRRIVWHVSLSTRDR